MPSLLLIGYGAMAGYVAAELRARGRAVACCLVQAGREDAARVRLGPEAVLIESVADLPEGAWLAVDCAGHAGLRAHGPALLRRGVPVITASIGALADPETRNTLEAAAEAGDARLTLASGAIGALDALSAARVGGLDRVIYTGRKPPAGWAGSAAEEVCDLDALDAPFVHFEGSAGEAARRYPKNANVAAAVALAGLGFEGTEARLIADPAATGNTHLVEAEGAFGAFRFEITGRGLPDTPRTSALAAMSMVDQVLRQSARIA